MPDIPMPAFGNGIKQFRRQCLLLARVENGNFGDTEALSSGLFELRCFFGGGIRVYYTIRNQRVVLLLVGGDKSSQDRDIEKAKAIFDTLED